MKIIRIATIPLSLKVLFKGQMKYMKDRGHEVIMVSADGKEREGAMIQEGVPHIIVPFSRSITPGKDIVCLLKLIWVFLKEKPDLIHANTPKAGLLGMLGGWICGVKVRIYANGGHPMLVAKGFRFRILKAMEKLTCSVATNVWANSKSLHQYILEQNLISKNKLELLAGVGSSNGVDFTIFSKEALKEDILTDVKQNLNYSSDNAYILSVGRLVKDKGIEEVVKGFIEISKNISHLKLILIGSFEQDVDPLPQDILTAIESDQNIIHIPWTEHLEYYLSLATLLVHASYREGFPQILMQAGAMKCPVVCSSVTGNIDLIEDRKTGLLFPAQNKIKLKETVLYAIKNDTLMNKLSQNLFELLKLHFDQKIIHKKIYQRYLDLFNHSPVLEKEYAK